jgi:hypothetical protein
MLPAEASVVLIVFICVLCEVCVRLPFPTVALHESGTRKALLEILHFLPVSKARTNKLYIFRQCTYIISYKLPSDRLSLFKIYNLFVRALETGRKWSIC